MHARTGTQAVKCGIHSGTNSCVIQRISAAVYGILSGAKTHHHHSHHQYTLIPTGRHITPPTTHNLRRFLNKRECDNIRVVPALQEHY